MSYKFDLVDFVKIQPDAEMMKLSKTDKHRLMDRVLMQEDSVVAGAPRGLEITFDLSHGGRKINNRVYPPRGQRDGVETWLEPYPKPILLNHDMQGDPLGRFSGMKWVSTEAEALQFFQSTQDFMRFKAAFDSDDPQAMYRALTRYGLLHNDKWPGLSKLEATARITDQAAIEKFLDGRYLTFSAGSHTDKYRCGICASAWHEDDLCEHRPGVVTEDGDYPVFFTGGFYGREGSVVNGPADNLGQVSSLRPVDADNSAIGAIDFSTDESTIFITDAHLDTWDSLPSMPPKPSKKPLDKLMDMDARLVAKQLIDGSLDQELADALAARTHLEISWLIRVHDALHAEFDWRVRYPDESEEDLPIPKDAYRLHGDIHNLSTEKNFRGSLVNGSLDHFDSEGAPSEEYVMKTPKSSDAVEAAALEDLKDQILKNLKSEILAEVMEAVSASDSANESADETNDNEDANGNQSENQEDQEEEGNQEDEGQAQGLLSQSDTVLGLVELLQETRLGDKALSKEDRDALDASDFALNGKFLPVVDAAHLEAALQVAEAFKDEDKAAMVESINEVARRKGLIDSDCPCGECKCGKVKTLQEDYAQALQQIDALKASQSESQDDSAEENEDSADNSGEGLANQDSNDGSIDPSQKDSGKTDDFVPKQVENPAFSNTEEARDQRRAEELGDFEQNVLNKYVQIKDEFGEESAMHHIAKLKRQGYLDRSFDPRQLLTKE